MTLALFLLLTCFAKAQQTQPASSTSPDELVSIDLPSEGVELRTLADIVTKRLGIPILYDETIANKKVVIRVPREVPASALLGVLESALRLKGFMLVDAVQPGWKQIVQAPEGATGAGAAGHEPELQTSVYRLKYMTPERLDRLVQAIVPESARRGYQSMPDRESQSLIASATPAVHKQIEQLIAQLDVAPTAERSPVRFYKLRNTKAADVLATIQDLLGHSDTSNGTASPGVADTTYQDAGGPNAPAARSVLPNSMQSQSTLTARLPLVGVAPASAGGPTTQPTTPGGVHTGDATVTADPNTNSIIVIAPPAVQTMYADLVQRLDIRRPQVQIECTLVTLDTSGNYSFGVDISRLGGFNTNQILTFSSFGISTLDPKTGQLTPVAARGGTFALLGPDITNIVIRALAQNSRARLVSAPQLLVNDNGHGQLKSVSEQPFAEILTTVGNPTQTSLGGYAQAGTTITVEPHISDGDYLQLSYAVELSNFTGAASNGLPPPSQRNQVESTVTIPDGSTIVVGGLSLKNLTNAVDSIPVINQIPFMNWIFGTHAGGSTETTLFVFIRPTILRDDQFQDLKYISDKNAAAAGIEGSYPSSAPLPLR